jgi:hypothetical protein
MQPTPRPICCGGAGYYSRHTTTGRSRQQYTDINELTAGTPAYIKPYSTRRQSSLGRAPRTYLHHIAPSSANPIALLQLLLQLLMNLPSQERTNDLTSTKSTRTVMPDLPRRMSQSADGPLEYDVTMMSRIGASKTRITASPSWMVLFLNSSSQWPSSSLPLITSKLTCRFFGCGGDSGTAVVVVVVTVFLGGAAVVLVEVLVEDEAGG